jgi:uncharacterized protein (DUF1778 family)
MSKPTSITLDLNEVPAAGDKQIVLRCRERDKSMVDDAAEILGMSQAEFMRVTSVQAARKVVAAKKAAST